MKNYLKNKVRVELKYEGSQKTQNYLLDAAKDDKSAMKVGDILAVDNGNKMERMVITAFYRTDGTYNGKPLKNCVYGYVERNGKRINLNYKKMKSNKMMGSMLDKFKNIYMPEVAENLRISMNGLVCVPVDGEYVSIDANGELVSFPENFTIEMPVYIIQRPIEQIQVDDIVARGKNYFKVSEIVKNPDGSVKDLKTISYSGFNHTVKAVKDFMLGQKYIRVVINLFNGFNGTEINPLMYAAFQDEDEDNNNILMYLIAMQAMNPNGGTGVLANMNPFVMMAFANGEGGGNNLLQNMFMMQMMQNMGGGMGNFNPFGGMNNMFQTQAPVMQTVPEKQTLND